MNTPQPNTPQPGDKVNLCGIDVTIASEEDCEKVEYVICVRVGGMHVEPYFNPHNIPSNCCRCGKPVNRDGRGPKKPKSLCTICVMEEVDGVQSTTK